LFHAFPSTICNGLDLGCFQLLLRWLLFCQDSSLPYAERFVGWRYILRDILSESKKNTPSPRGDEAAVQLLPRGERWHGMLLSDTPCAKVNRLSIMGEEKPEEELMGKRKSSPRLSATTLRRYP
jgi:hypothetical protein